MRYAVVMAGGAGKRLWPASRQDRPKQLIELVDGRCLLQLALERLEGLFPPERMMVVTSDAYADQVAECYPAMPRENIIGEPEGRDTANAIALAAELLAARDPDATMAVFTADHIIRPKDVFQKAVETACRAAEEDPRALVIFGIRPTYPHTGLGYIHCKLDAAGGPSPVLGFKEKPERHLARFYVESGDYFWNSGMFVWKVATILEALKTYLPESIKRLDPVGAAARVGQDYSGQLRLIYPQLVKISIDVAVMEKTAPALRENVPSADREKAPHALMVELNAQWLDVGSWPALDGVVEADADGNTVVASRAVLRDSSNNIVYSTGDHLIAVMGIDDSIIVHTPDATLVCDRNDSQRLKELVDTVGKRFGKDYI